MELKNESPDALENRGNAHGKRVLLLEDDEQLADIIKELLISHGYPVVAVSNGAEGIREIQAGDFEVIVCDMMMPNLPGDMFYLAVERMRPHLCDHFIFITGYHGSPKVIEFINKVNGIMLTKPFRMDDLLDLIGFVQLRACLH